MWKFFSRPSLALFLFLTLSISFLSAKAEIDPAAEGDYYSDSIFDPFVSVTGAVTAIAPGVVIGMVRGAVDMTGTAWSRIHKSDSNTFFKGLGTVFSPVFTVPLGMVTGVVIGARNALDDGVQEPFSEGSFSLDSEWKD